MRRSRPGLGWSHVSSGGCVSSSSEHDAPTETPSECIDPASEQPLLNRRRPLDGDRFRADLDLEPREYAMAKLEQRVLVVSELGELE